MFIFADADVKFDQPQTEVVFEKRPARSDVAVGNALGFGPWSLGFDEHPKTIPK